MHMNLMLARNGSESWTRWWSMQQKLVLGQFQDWPLDWELKQEKEQHEQRWGTWICRRNKVQLKTNLRKKNHLERKYREDRMGQNERGPKRESRWCRQDISCWRTSSPRNCFCILCCLVNSTEYIDIQMRLKQIIFFVKICWMLSFHVVFSTHDLHYINHDMIYVSYLVQKLKLDITEFNLFCFSQIEVQSWEEVLRSSKLQFTISVQF